ncbi:hypothetical protein BDV96DRAFT_650376 [Lophiotrema nucula]|uniref:Uncharacterized protein n=1 Tax=Lophiotrema nucula TaxID=690887 RepID=A0A6A5YXG2_9PLEO|nr:hypothetical protein BDV96DRAFT_650376 [Lophiotrema nucula]
MSTPSSALFLALPREIRDQIYRDCFDEGDYLFRHGEIEFTLTYLGSHGTGRDRRLPLGLLTCKQILIESIDMFLSHVVCTSYATTVCTGNGLIPPTSIQKVEVVSWYNSQELVAEIGEVGESNVVTLEPVDEFWTFIQYLQASPAPCLKDLTLKFRLPADLAVAEIQGSWRVDLVRLLTIARGLDRVEFIIEEPRLDPRSPETIKTSAIVYRAVQRTLAQTARYLIDTAHVEMCVVRDWLHERSIDEDDEVAEHNWHVECRKGLRASQHDQLGFEGLRCWSDRYGLLENHHYQLYSNPDHSRAQWYSSKADRMVTVEMPI